MTCQVGNTPIPTHEINNAKRRHNDYMSTINLSDVEKKVIMDSLASERISIAQDQKVNPKLEEYLGVLSGLEDKLAVH